MAIELSRELDKEQENAEAYYELGKLLSYLGRWRESDEDLIKGESMEKDKRNTQGQGIAWSYRSQLVT